MVRVPKYQYGRPFDIVRTIKGMQSDVKALQVQASGNPNSSLNQSAASLNANPYFWGGDGTGWTGINGTFDVSSIPPVGAAYPYAGIYVNNGTSIGYASEQNGLFVATPLQNYQVVAWVYPTSTSVVLGMNWFNASLGALTGATNPTFTLTANTWSRISANLVAPLATNYACPIIGPAAADGSTVYIQSVTVMPISAPGAWQDLRPLANSFNGSISNEWPPQYRINSDGDLDLVGSVGLPASGSYNSITWATLPSGFRVAKISSAPVAQIGGAMSTDSNAGSPRLFTDSSGNLQFAGISPSINGTTVRFGIITFPLGSSPISS